MSARSMCNACSLLLLSLPRPLPAQSVHDTTAARFVCTVSGSVAFVGTNATLPGHACNAEGNAGVCATTSAAL
eukprot:13184707-Alexandrium_andersonii.AAC.1